MDIDLLSNLRQANIELRSKVKRLEKRNHELSRKNGALQTEVKKLREKLRNYGLGRHNQLINKNNSTIKIKPYHLQAIVENYCDLPHNSIYVKNQKRPIAFARQLYIFFVRKYTTLSLPKLAKDFDMDHTTFVYATQKISEMIENGEPEFMKLYNRMEEKIAETKETGKFNRTRQKKISYANHH
jgi:regulator of replication initiation timing